MSDDNGNGTGKKYDEGLSAGDIILLAVLAAAMLAFFASK